MEYLEWCFALDCPSSSKFVHFHLFACSTVSKNVLMSILCVMFLGCYKLPLAVLLTADFTAKIADFGLAKVSDSKDTKLCDSLTSYLLQMAFLGASSSGGFKGTPLYTDPASLPARLGGCLCKTTKVDVYAFGLLLVRSEHASLQLCMM